MCEDADERSSVDGRRSKADVAELLATAGIDREKFEVLGCRFLFRAFNRIILIHDKSTLLTVEVEPFPESKEGLSHRQLERESASQPRKHPATLLTPRRATEGRFV